MDTQTKELIAVGASVTAHCEPCLHYHISKAREAGVTAEAIDEAVAVGKMVRTGARRKMDWVIAETLDALAAPGPAETEEPDVTPEPADASPTDFCRHAQAMMGAFMAQGFPAKEPGTGEDAASPTDLCASAMAAMQHCFAEAPDAGSAGTSAS